MTSLGRGQSSSATDPILDVFVKVGDPPALAQVDTLGFRILDVSDDAKLANPVQVFPLPSGFFALDPNTDAPTGHRLKVGQYFAPFTVPAAEALGLHRIEWEIQQNPSAPVEVHSQDFLVTESVVASDGCDALLADYCTIEDVRCEGFEDVSKWSDARITSRIKLATRYIDKMTGRWFNARTFGPSNRMMVDGKGSTFSGMGIFGGSRTLHLEIPIIRVDKLLIEVQGLIDPSLFEVDAGQYRVYNRHVSGMTQPDDRENPRISFINTRIDEVIASGLFPAPRTFVSGRLNVHLEGTFGYTDPDGSEFGETPLLIQQAACRLAARDLFLDSDLCGKLNHRNAYRIVSDREDKTTIRLQDLWLKGAFTGDPEIDSILMAYKRPPRIAVA